jgi:hypothetical protein
LIFSNKPSYAVLNLLLKISYFSIGFIQFDYIISLEDTLQLGYNKWNVFLPAPADNHTGYEGIFIFDFFHFDVEFGLVYLYFPS